jgi:hypothetical protein
MCLSKLFLNVVCSLFTCIASSQPVIDTITTLQTNRTKPAVFKAPNGKFYKVTFKSDPSRPATKQSINCGEVVFAGKHRAAAKTSFVTGVATKSFNSISELIASLTPDSIIRPKLTRNSKRIADEQKNVRLEKSIFLYAMKNEDDNDYHLIIGDNIKLSKANLFNIEISGVPKSGNTTILKVRNFFKDNFGQVCGPKYAVFKDDPIPIKVSGSVFYDVDHPAGQVGPVGMRPKTSWEIHPVASISW